jgi:hypothetical protein
MRTVLVLILAASGLLGQETPLARLKREANRMLALAGEDGAEIESSSQLAAVHLALRDWIGSGLPRNRGITGDYKSAEVILQSELKDAGLNMPDTADKPEGPGLGYVGVELQWQPELADTLFVVASASVMCGTDDAVYMYRSDDNKGWTRVLEDHPKGGWGYTAPEIALSEPDSRGRRLLVTHYISAQCASTWMRMAYSVYRLGGPADTPEKLLSDQHDFWLGDDPEFVVKPDNLIIEFLDRSVDAGIHNRTEIQRYNFSDGVQRLDPVALQPQDFAEEWLTRPWSEMESRSANSTKEWHERLHRDPLFAEYASVIYCAATPGRWLIGLDIGSIGEKDAPKPGTRYFLVRDLGSYHYRMEAVSATRPSGCQGKELFSDAGHASDEHPWLSVEKLKAIR